MKYFGIEEERIREIGFILALLVFAAAVGALLG